MQLHWCGASRFHDWLDRDRSVPRNMLMQARDAGVVGHIDWMSVGPDDELVQITRGTKSQTVQDDDIWMHLLGHKPKRGGLYRIAAGGETPYPWRMTLGLFPYEKSCQQVSGYNILNLWFESDAFPGAQGSNNLAQHFRLIHTQDNTEFAFIHPYQRWVELVDALGGHYEYPLTIGPMFCGVFWANFLGRNHLNFFDCSRLKQLTAYELEWVAEESLYFRVSPEVCDAPTFEVEKEMFRLTEEFRARLS